MSKQTLHEARDLWSRARPIIQKKLQPKDFTTWVEGLEPSALADGMLTLNTPFGLFRTRVRESFLPQIEEGVSEAAGKKCGVDIAVGACDVGLDVSGQSGVVNSAAKERKPRDTSRSDDQESVIEKRTFKNFLVGDGNRMAYAFAERLAQKTDEREGQAMFLYGGVGLGKTHLLYAIINVLRARGERVTCFQGEDFTRKMVEALKAREMEKFHKALDRADMLLIDDVQFLAGKPRTQLEILHVFDRFGRNGKPIGLTSDRLPGEIESLEAGLQNRFQGSLLAELGPLDKDLRLRILRAKLSDAGVVLVEHNIQRLAMDLQGSVRELEGLVSRLQVTKQILDLPLGEGDIETILEPYGGRRQRGDLGLETIIEVVAWTHGLTTEELLSRDRSRRVARPRHIAAFFCRTLTRASLPEIGDTLGGRNHTSILRAVRSITDRQQGDARFAARIQQMKKLLNSSKPMSEKRA